ncbi:division/cell wall cluster transcriptional repressor MraZ [Dokdonella sp.]|uniref:division/cell wall cluster transcriptional repressor MraZ n=1 Tax=Dokdonella sp. TaxID=2291710 RepID=UPI0025BC9EDD|nr:division/cell wall cluster transcriptional repressor MraZ [Dokdonella sp.]MBX3689266.1 division/cell wall cluster transcriptional repressor MraZ [Dokdonella sp.]
MFQGETAITIDDKGRAAIPAAHRDAVAAAGGHLVVTYNPFEHGCLWIYPQAEWERVRDSVMALATTVKVHRDIQRKLVGAAMHVEPDANGRIQLPASHRGFSGIEKRAVLLGMGEKLELWSEQAHQTNIRQTIGEDAITDGMLDLRL